MANKLYEENSVRRIAEAVRRKGGDALYKIADLASAILALPDRLTGTVIILLSAMKRRKRQCSKRKLPTRSIRRS